MPYLQIFTDSSDCQIVRLSKSSVEQNCVDNLCQRTTCRPVPASNAFGCIRQASSSGSGFSLEGLVDHVVRTLPRHIRNAEFSAVSDFCCKNTCARSLPLCHRVTAPYLSLASNESHRSIFGCNRSSMSSWLSSFRFITQRFCSKQGGAAGGVKCYVRPGKPPVVQVEDLDRWDWTMQIDKVWQIRLSNLSRFCPDWLIHVCVPVSVHVYEYVHGIVQYHTMLWYNLILYDMI